AESGVRDAGVVGMTREPHLEFLGDGNDALEEVRDALPGEIRGDMPGVGERRILPRFGQAPGAVLRAASAFGRRRPQDTEQVHVVLDRRDAGSSGASDDLARLVDLLLAL